MKALELYIQTLNSEKKKFKHMKKVLLNKPFNKPGRKPKKITQFSENNSAPES